MGEPLTKSKAEIMNHNSKAKAGMSLIDEIYEASWRSNSKD